MASEVIITLTGLFCTTVSSIVTFILTKRKYNTEVDSQQIKNMNDSFDVYKKMMEETLDSQKKMMEATIEYNSNTISAQNKKIEALQKENEVLRQQVADLQMQLIKFFGNNYNPQTSQENL